MVLILFHFGRLMVLVSILTASQQPRAPLMVLLNVAAARGPAGGALVAWVQDAELHTSADTACCERDGVTYGPRRHLSCRRTVEDERCYVNRRDGCVGLRRPIDLQYGLDRFHLFLQFDEEPKEQPVGKSATSVLMAAQRARSRCV
jgi:hypothetical protein